MKIAIIEDNIHKRRKIKTFLVSKFKENKFTFGEASSYSSGLDLLEEENFDFLILDMSMPTYDITSNHGGGKFRVFGGKDILKRLKRKKKLIPFVIVTQYSTFSESTGIHTLEEITQEIAKVFPDYFNKVIFYDTTSTAWKNELLEVLNKYD